MQPRHRSLKGGFVWRYFWGAHQRFFRDLCIASKVPATIDQANKALEADKVRVVRGMGRGLERNGACLGLAYLIQGRDFFLCVVFLLKRCFVCFDQPVTMSLGVWKVSRFSSTAVCRCRHNRRGVKTGAGCMCCCGYERMGRGVFMIGDCGR